MAEKVGIVVEATDKASSVLKGIGAAGKSSLDTVRTAGTKAGSVLKAVGMAGVFLNQGLEIAKKGFEMFRMVVLDSVQAMVEYRGEHDAISQRFKRMGDEAKQTRAAIGNVFIPVIFGLQDAFRKTGVSLVDYINTNRKLIATNIIEFLAATARILTTGVAEGAIWVSRAVSGLIEVWHALSAVVNIAVGAMLEGWASIEAGAADLASHIPGIGDDIAKALRSDADNARLLGEEFSRSGEESVAALESVVAKQAKLEDGIASTRDTVVDFIDNKAVPAMLKWADSLTPVIAKSQQFHAVIVNQRQAFDSLRVSASAHYERLAMLGEKDAAYFQQKEMEKTTAFQASAAAQGAAATALFTTLINESDQGAAAVIKAVVRAANIAVQAYIAQGMAAAAAANAGIPGVGWIIAGAAAATVGAVIESFLAKIPKAARGGVVTGGTPGRDSVLVQAHEGILQGGQTKLFQKLGSTLERLDRHGVSAGGGAGNVQISLNMQALDISEPETKKRMLLGLANEIDELVNDRLLLSGVARAG